MSKSKVAPQPCPCCGNKNLYTGHESASSMGVECMQAMGGCGLRVSRTLPDVMPPGVKSLKALDAHLLARAIKAWNRRT